MHAPKRGHRARSRAHPHMEEATALESRCTTPQRKIRTRSSHEGAAPTRVAQATHQRDGARGGVRLHWRPFNGGPHGRDSPSPDGDHEERATLLERHLEAAPAREAEYDRTGQDHADVEWQR